MSSYKVIERTPKYNGRPVCDGALTIEYHFRDWASADIFRMPKKLKGNYTLLREVIKHIGLDSYYRIAQKKV